jgi:hypothetical protein
MCYMPYPNGDDNVARWLYLLAGLIIIAVVVFA